MYDLMEDIVDFVLANFSLLLIIGVIIQMYLAPKKKRLWGLILPTIPMIFTLYWIGSPIKEGRQPTMTSMNVIPYWLLAAAYFITFAICRILSKKNN